MRFTGFILTAALLLLALAGCAGEPSYPRRAHALAPIAPQQLPASAELAQGTFARWPADASRLEADLKRAMKRIHWGLLERRWVEDAPAPRPLRAEALLPDNRTAVILAWPLNEKEVAAAVQVGRFGDPGQEHACLQMLADTLADKPMPTRGGTFELP